MKNKYLSQDYTQKLDSTIVRYNGEPVFLRVESATCFALYQLGDTTQLVGKIKPTDDSLDISSIPLGWYNNSANRRAFFYERAPVRKYKQGVCSANTNAYTHGGDRAPFDYFFSPSVVDGLKGKFPSLKAAVSLLEKSAWQSVAISRDVLLYKSKNIINVKIHNDDVGTYDPNTNILRIPPTTFGFVLSHIVSEFQWSVE